MRSLSSPPSPVLLRAPSLFMASASASCASLLIAPKDMAPATKCFTMFSTGSTFSISIGFRLCPKKSRRKRGGIFSIYMEVNSLNFFVAATGWPSWQGGDGFRIPGVPFSVLRKENSPLCGKMSLTSFAANPVSCRAMASLATSSRRMLRCWMSVCRNSFSAIPR